MALPIEEVNELAEALVNAYTSGGSGLVGLPPEAMKRQEVLDQLADWRARRLIAQYMGVSSVIQPTTEGFLYFRDRVAAQKQLP